MLEIFNKYSKTQIERAQELIDNIESLDLDSSKEINGVEKIKGYDNLAQYWCKICCDDKNDLKTLN